MFHEMATGASSKKIRSQAEIGNLNLGVGAAIQFEKALILATIRQHVQIYPLVMDRPGQLLVAHAQAAEPQPFLPYRAIELAVPI
jgi:hypothetical protein